MDLVEDPLRPRATASRPFDAEGLATRRRALVVDGVLQRVEGQVALSVICFYTDALPAVLDARDSELVRNIFAGLPVWYVMVLLD